MRWVTWVLAGLLVLVHADLWFGKGGVPHMLELRGKLEARQVANDAARHRNEQLAAEVSDLKEGLEMVEEKARFELGMIKPDEIYVQVGAGAGALSAWLQAIEPLFAGAFALHGTEVTWFEIVAFALALAMVFFNIRVNVLGWPLAIASSLLYLLLFARSRLYGDACLQVMFALLAAWGWRQWRRGADAAGSALQVHRLGQRGRLLAGLALLVAWPATALFLTRYTDTDVPWWDGFTTAASVLGQVLLGRKFVENWPTWLVVNVVATGLFAYKSLWLTAVLYAIFAVLSIVGWRAWLTQAGPRALTA